MEATLAAQADEIAAVIVEPLVQCAGNMRMYHPAYLALLREACDRHGVLLIADEIAVGFGRTGTLFACEQAGIRPDFLCLSKGLTGGYLPLSVVVTTEPVYAGVLRRLPEAHGLPALAQLHRQPARLRRRARDARHLPRRRRDRAQSRPRRAASAKRSAPLADHPHVAEVRQTGMIAAIEFVQATAQTGERYDWRERRGLRAYRIRARHRAHCCGRSAT